MMLSQYIANSRWSIISLSIATFLSICLYFYVSQHAKTSYYNLTSLLQTSDAVIHGDILSPSTSPNSTTHSQGVRHQATLNATYISPKVAVLGLHRLQENRQFGVFASDSFSSGYTYSFLLPLTTFAWKRLGYGSIVLIVGDLHRWKHKPPLDYILRHTLDKGAVVVFLEGVHRHHAVMLSQCSRLFAASLLSSAVYLNSSVLVTSDADLWPLQSYIFQAPPFTDPPDVISTNSFCCSPFKHSGTQHRMLPMSSIVATGATWQSLIAQKGSPPNSSDEIVSYITREFGAVARSSVHRGANDGWYMDQHLVSILIEDWQRINGDASVRLVGRNTRLDRIDDNRWQLWSLKGMTDAHLLRGSRWASTIWHRIQPLLKLMYDSQGYVWCEDYRKGFLELI